MAPGARESPEAPRSEDDHDQAELAGLLRSLDPAALETLRLREATHRARRAVLSAIERLQRWEPRA